MGKKAMIFAAGLGTRLAPLTDDKPKALVEVGGKTMLQRTIETLLNADVEEIVINVHHFADLIKRTIHDYNYTGVKFYISDESDMLLDTGGGLLKASDFLNGTEPFFVHNVDIISDINLKDMYQKHLDEQALATLAVSHRNSTRGFLWVENRLCGWQNIQTGTEIKCYSTPTPPKVLAFSGVHIISPSIFPEITETGKFSINQVYLRLAFQHKIMAYEHNANYWADLGTTEKIAQAEKILQKKP
ncbi:MAG: nucleotidyltransferase family protein [Bacteroidales bacterium]